MLPKQGSLVDSLRQSGVDLDEAGASMRLQTLYLRGIHDEIRHSMDPSSYGTSLAPQNSESLFDVSQLTDTAVKAELMLNTTGPSRMAFNVPNQAYYERDEAARTTNDPHLLSMFRSQATHSGSFC